MGDGRLRPHFITKVSPVLITAVSGATEGHRGPREGGFKKNTQEIFQITGPMALDKSLTAQPVGIYAAQTLGIRAAAAKGTHYLLSTFLHARHKRLILAFCRDVMPQNTENKHRKCVFLPLINSFARGARLQDDNTGIEPVSAVNTYGEARLFFLLYLKMEVSMMVN